MSEPVINAETRKDTGKGVARKLRQEGRIPGIFYFHGKENIPFSLNRKELLAIMAHESTIIEVVFDNKTRKKCIIRDVQFDPITAEPIHVDLMGIELTEKLDVSVPVVLVGTPEGVKTSGGVLEQQLREVQIRCLPTDIPEHIEIDVSNLEIGDVLHWSDIQLDKIEVLEDPNTVIAIVVPPRVMAEKEIALEEEEEAEPEIVGKSEEQKED